MLEAIFATHNSHKAWEVSQMLPEWLHIKTLSELHLEQDIAETGESLKENAYLKAAYAYKLSGGRLCFADDTGLEVQALGGRPGVRSARYASVHATAKENLEKLLYELKDTPTPRLARFVTVIALIDSGEVHYFQGFVEGEILTAPRGGDGFGYDPVFRPTGSQLCFAEMTAVEKNKISHRALAFSKLKTYLETRGTTIREECN